MFIVKAPERVQKWSCEELFLDRCQSCRVVSHHLLMLVALWSDLTWSERTPQVEDGISSCQGASSSCGCCCKCCGTSSSSLLPLLGTQSYLGHLWRASTQPECTAFGSSSSLGWVTCCWMLQAAVGNRHEWIPAERLKSSVCLEMLSNTWQLWCCCLQEPNIKLTISEKPVGLNILITPKYNESKMSDCN